MGTFYLRMQRGQFPNLQPLTSEDYDKILSYIRCTRFPYKTDGSALSLQEQIIRDSDILQGLFAQDYIMGVVAGISQEAKIPMKNMLAGQEGFLTGTKFCTEWATELSKERLPEVLLKVNTVKEFY